MRSFLKKQKLLSWLAGGFILMIPVSLLHAQLLPVCAITSGNCSICDILDTAIRILRWLLGILGGSALFLFVWHGFGWLTSMGNKEKIEASRKALINTVIGLIIILASWYIVNLVISLVLTPVNSPNLVQSIFSAKGPEWYKYCTNISLRDCANKSEGALCGSGEFCLTRCKPFGTADPGTPAADLDCLEREFTCGKTDFLGEEFNDACHFFSTAYPQLKDYQCLPDNLCVSGKKLGTGYCTNNDLNCCAPNN